MVVKINLSHNILGIDLSADCPDQTRALKISFKVLAKSKTWPKHYAYGSFVCVSVDFHLENCCLLLM